MNEPDDCEGITLFAAIKTFYENGNDILSAVCSLVLVTIKDGDNLDSIKEHFNDKYKVSMPGAVLQTILKRLKRNGFVECSSHFTETKKTDEGRKEAASLTSSVKDLRRDFTALVNNLGSYFKLRGYSEIKNPEQALLSFIDENLGYASMALSASEDKKINNDSSHIAEYIVHVEKSEPTIFVLLQNVFFGRLYLSMIRTRAEYSATTQMDSTQVYLDTSLVMSLLGLHEKIDCDRAKELLGILIGTANVEICVFNSTVDEARHLLESYQSDSVNYTRNLKVNTIHSELKRQGYDRYRISLLIESLEDRIDKLGIKIYDLPFTDETDKYREVRSDLAVWAGLLENPKGQYTLDHDANALYGIHCLRRNIRSKLFEKCHAVFVSPDRAIHEMTKELSEKNNKFPLSMTPLNIVSMLWMRDIGNAEIATNVLRQSVMAYVREKAISHKLWNTFITALKEAQEQEKLTKEDAAMILASDDLSRLLAEKQYDAPKELIDHNYVEKLRVQGKKLSDNAKHGEEVISGVKKTVHKFSHILALSCTWLATLIIIIIVAPALYFLIIRLGIDRLASIIAVGALSTSFILCLIFEKEIKPAIIILGFKKRFYNKAYSIFHSWIEKNIVGEQLDEAQ